MNFEKSMNSGMGKAVLAVFLVFVLEAMSMPQAWAAVLALALVKAVD